MDNLVTHPFDMWILLLSYANDLLSQLCMAIMLDHTDESVTRMT